MFSWVKLTWYRQCVFSYLAHLKCLEALIAGLMLGTRQKGYYSSSRSSVIVILYSAMPLGSGEATYPIPAMNRGGRQSHSVDVWLGSE